MNSLQAFILVLLLGFFIGCDSDDPCRDVDCGPGDCIEGICDCPDGFIGDNCEIALCSGVPCVNGDCDQLTETCNCYPNYFGEECDRLCVNGLFSNGNCNCDVGYEGSTCAIESRDRFLGWWGYEQWTYTPEIGGTPVPGILTGSSGSLKFECGNTIAEVEIFPTENSNGIMLLSTDDKIVGRVSGKTIDFELQYLTTEVAVYGSASLGDDLIFIIELYFVNSTTSNTEVANGTFTIFRHYKDCE